jgi:hypothetical protein
MSIVRLAFIYTIEQKFDYRKKEISSFNCKSYRLLSDSILFFSSIIRHIWKMTYDSKID